MNFTTLLSIKRALRFALPCFASCLLLTACSSEGSELNPDESGSSAPGAIRFTASVSSVSDAATTRIGIKDDAKPNVGGEEYRDEEPVIWIGDEKLSVFFVSNTQGTTITAMFEVDGESISEDGKSADLVNVTDLSLLDLNGEYTVYAITPYDESNSLNSTSIDLSGQTQAASATNYSHLGETAYMRAEGVTATFANGSLTQISGNLDFEHITSFLRFHLKNGMDGAINVTGIKLAHSALFDKAIYNFNSETVSAASNVDTELSLTFGAEGISLASAATFDAYMSAFELTMLEGESDDLKLIFTYTKGGNAYVKTFPLELTDLEDEYASDVIFPAGSRFLFVITLNGADETFEYGGKTYTAIKYGDDYYTPADYVPTGFDTKEHDGAIYVRPKNANPCPENYSLPAHSALTALSGDQLKNLYTALGLSTGFYEGNNFVYGNYLALATRGSNMNSYWNCVYVMTNGTNKDTKREFWYNDVRYVQIRCVKDRD